MNDAPNPVVATTPAEDGGTIRIYLDGMVDAVDGDAYSLSPGFRSVGAARQWIGEQVAEAARRVRVGEAADAYMTARDGEPRPRGKVGPTPEAVRVLEHVHAAHMRGDGLELSHIGASVLWAEIMRRSCETLSANERLENATRAAERALGRPSAKAVRDSIETDTGEVCTSTIPTTTRGTLAPYTKGR